MVSTARRRVRDRGGGAMPEMQPHHWMAIYSFFASVICYVDRTNISVAMIPAAKQHDWDVQTQGLIFSGFFMGYATTQVLGGIWAERYGGAWVLLAAVMLWSFFTLITPSCADSLWTMMFARIGLGAGEGIAMPAMQQITSKWYPEESRSRYNALSNSGMQLGIVVSLLLAPLIAESWEAVFQVLGLVGILWGILFFIFPPRGALDVSGKAASSRALPWHSLLTKKPFWAIYISHFGGGFGFFILITWLPEYFVKHLGVPLEDVAEFTIPAYVCGAIATNVAGALCDRAIASGWCRLTVRRLAQGTAMVGGSVALIVCTLMPKEYATPGVVAVCMCLALASHGCHPSGNMANIMEVAPDNSGITHGVSNTIATTSGVVGNLFVGYILPIYGWPAVFGTAVVVYLVCLGFFLAWSSSTPQLEYTR